MFWLADAFNASFFFCGTGHLPGRPSVVVHPDPRLHPAVLGAAGHPGKAKRKPARQPLLISRARAAGVVLGCDRASFHFGASGALPLASPAAAAERLPFNTSPSWCCVQKKSLKGVLLHLNDNRQASRRDDNPHLVQGSFFLACCAFLGFWAQAVCRESVRCHANKIHGRGSLTDQRHQISAISCSSTELKIK